MTLYNLRTLDFRFNDARGSLVQLVHEGFSQVNVVVNGSVEVTLMNKEKTECVTFRQGDFFEIPPFVLHNMYFPEDCLMVQLYSIPVENADGTKDIFMEDEFNA